MDFYLLVRESLIALGLLAWVVLVVLFISKRLYESLVFRGSGERVSIYYTRKIVHMLAGGLVAFLVPFVFKTPLFPLTLSLLLGLFTYLPHRRGRLMEWFQVPDNLYEVHFCVMWGAAITLAWFIFDGNFWYGVVPVSFMAFGDGVTGIVRNVVYKRRTKAWIGNLAMALVTIPLGWVMVGASGALAGLTASVVEHFEWKKIDDNVTIPLSALLVLVIFKA